MKDLAIIAKAFAIIGCISFAKARWRGLRFDAAVTKKPDTWPGSLSPAFVLVQ